MISPTSVPMIINNTMSFGHWAGQNRVGVRVLAMMRRLQPRKTGRQSRPATQGKKNKRGLLRGVTHAKISDMIRHLPPIRKQIGGAGNQ